MTISSRDLKKIVERALGAEAANTAELIETVSGSINDVFRIRNGTRDYALRIRLREHLFRYEKELFKETVAANFLVSTLTSGVASDNEKVLETAIGSVAPTLQFPQNSLLPQTVCQDGSRTVIPFPWVMQDWVAGEPLAQGRAELYRAAGGSLAGLHACGFPRFKPTLHDPWLDGDVWLESMVGQGEKLAAELGIVLPSRSLLTEIFGAINTFCLNHNDLQPFNIIASADKILFIDWDNLQIGPPEFDLVKLKYWTDCDKDGFLRPNPEKYGSFLEGYREASGRKIDSAVARFCEIIWLLRVTSFEVTREAQGHTPAPPFCGSDYYRDCLTRLIRNT